MTASSSLPLCATDLYFNDFNGPSGSTFPEWTSTGWTCTANQTGSVGQRSGPQTAATVASPNGKQKFLGEFGGPAIVTAPPYDPQHFVRVDETVSLTLQSLPRHSSITVAFDLYVLKSWDGNNPNYGPDRWRLSVSGGPTLLDTTFSNNPKTDAYNLSQQNYPSPNSAMRSGAAAVNTMGYTFYGDSIYHLSFTFPHGASSLNLNFWSSLFEGKGTDDESWGLDNVRVTADAPAPAAFSAAAAIAGLAPESLAAIYGSGFSTATQGAATLPLPLQLAGVSVIVTDSAGTARTAPLVRSFAGHCDGRRAAPGPRSGEVDLVLSVDGLTSNTGRISIQ